MRRLHCRKCGVSYPRVLFFRPSHGRKRRRIVTAAILLILAAGWVVDEGVGGGWQAGPLAAETGGGMSLDGSGR